MKKRQRIQELAESKFKTKERQLSAGEKVMAEQEAARQAVSANTARLKALRLARDAAAAETGAAEQTMMLSAGKR
jgi:hypothetical protein